MRELTLEEIKSSELEVLKEIHKICREQNISYSLAGGTLLGAVRHGGFIPWDDDIDIFMPRQDYEKLIDYCKNNETGFKLLASETDDRYGYLFAKAMDMKTVLIEENGNPKNIDMGVFVDIFPVDGLGESYEKAVKTLNSTRFKRELLVARNWKKFFRSKTRSWIYEPVRFAFFVMSRFTSEKKLIKSIQEKSKKTAFDDSKYIGCICGSYRTKEILEKGVFDEYTEIAFEDTSFMVIKEYDKYLSSIYGDYMKLPPEEKRVTHHTFKAYVRDQEEQ